MAIKKLSLAYSSLLYQVGYNRRKNLLKTTYSFCLAMRLHQRVGGSTGLGCSQLRSYWRENIFSQPKQPSFYLGQYCHLVMYLLLMEPNLPNGKISESTPNENIKDLLELTHLILYRVQFAITALEATYPDQKSTPSVKPPLLVPRVPMTAFASRKLVLET